MSDFRDAFLNRALESLDGAESEFASGRYNNVANRAYYACFQAAIVALEMADVKPTAGKTEWSHSFVQSQFSGVLIGRRKRYSSSLREALQDGTRLRHQADYGQHPVSRSQAVRFLDRARTFVDAISTDMRRSR